MSGRAVITGVGPVAPTGVGADDYWQATLNGASGLRRISRFDPVGLPTTVAGEVHGLEPADSVDHRILAQTDRWSHFGLVGAVLALDHALLDPADHGEFDIGVVTASSSGGNAFGQREIQALWARGPRHVGPYQSIAWFYAASTGQISINHTLKGPCAVVCSEGAGGLDALAHARRAIRRDTPAMLAGGMEAPLSPYAMTCQLSAGGMSAEPDPRSAYRPFAPDATGYVPGEGGAMLLVEEAGHAEARGVPALAEISGYAAAFAAPREPELPSGDWAGTRHALATAIRGALRDAGLTGDDVDAVFADAVGLAEADEAEALALHDVLGARCAGVPVTAPKAGVGRLYAGGAALDVAAATFALRDAALPPTPGHQACGHDLDLVTDRPRPARLRHVLVLARVFGGFAAATVLSRPAPRTRPPSGVTPPPGPKTRARPMATPPTDQEPTLPATSFTEDDVTRLLARTAGVTVAVDRDSAFEDLGIDSLALLGLVQVIESEHGVTLPDDTEGSATVGEFLDTVNTSLAQVA